MRAKYGIGTLVEFKDIDGVGTIKHVNAILKESGGFFYRVDGRNDYIPEKEILNSYRPEIRRKRKPKLEVDRAVAQ